MRAARRLRTQLPSTQSCNEFVRSTTVSVGSGSCSNETLSYLPPLLPRSTPPQRQSTSTVKGALKRTWSSAFRSSELRAGFCTKQATEDDKQATEDDNQATEDDDDASEPPPHNSPWMTGYPRAMQDAYRAPEKGEESDDEENAHAVVTPSGTKSKYDWLLRILGYYSPFEIRHRAAQHVYQKACDHSIKAQFWDVFGLEQTFRVELQLLALHMWIAKTRALETPYPPYGRKLSKRAFFYFFEELVYRFEHHITGMISTWERDCQTVIFQLCLALDHAEQDQPDDEEAFAKAVWKNLYNERYDMEHNVLFLWSDYIQREIAMLKQITDEDFLEGNWEFGPIPTMEDLQALAEEMESTADGAAEEKPL